MKILAIVVLAFCALTVSVAEETRQSNATQSELATVGTLPNAPSEIESASISDQSKPKPSNSDENEYTVVDFRPTIVRVRKPNGKWVVTVSPGTTVWQRKSNPSDFGFEASNALPPSILDVHHRASIFNKKLILFEAAGLGATVLNVEATRRYLDTHPGATSSGLLGQNPTRRRMYGLYVPMWGLNYFLAHKTQANYSKWWKIMPLFHLVPQLAMASHTMALR